MMATDLLVDWTVAKNSHENVMIRVTRITGWTKLTITSSLVVRWQHSSVWIYAVQFYTGSNPCRWIQKFWADAFGSDNLSWTEWDSLSGDPRWPRGIGCCCAGITRDPRSAAFSLSLRRRMETRLVRRAAHETISFCLHWHCTGQCSQPEV